MKSVNNTFRNIIIIAVLTLLVVGVVYLSKDIPVPTEKVTKVIENSRFSK